ncbi:MAG: type I-B CRISPR-associated endonuclease Cas1 [Ignavibacteriaceae bacterium]|nr:type I-B CRISPR-associated endonuclease Cas1 [Ignavibacteriaceae bacterium]
MKQNIYLFSDTLIKRKDHSIICEKICRKNDVPEEDAWEEYEKEEFVLGEDIQLPAGDKKYIPIESIESILTFGSVRFNSRFLYFLSQNQIPLHVFSIKGNYAGSFIPSERNNSGSILISQVLLFRNQLKRLDVAKQFVLSAIGNAQANLKYHFNRGAHLSDFMQSLDEIKEYVTRADSITELMGLEGTAKKCYYSAWAKIFKFPVEFTSRVKNPPNNLINALISYGNMIVYSVCLNEIYHTRLYPEIGFLHEPGEAKLSLSYDIAEIFKPLITDRTIFKVINKNMISENDAVIKNHKCILKKSARITFAQEIENKLLTKIQIEGKEKKITYRRLIREECYKLLNYILNQEKYEAYITKW